jgi:Cu(I)/Ag(I) efflux system membrane protein CusA/SilA
MIEKLIEWSCKNRFFVFMGTAVAIAMGLWSLVNVPLDAIPDLSDVQVIVFTEWPGRSPDLMEDQITYPIVSSMIAAPQVSVVRGYSFFGLSFVYVIFEDGTDIYWARSRILEYLSKIRGNLPKGVNPILGPDATGVGWVFEYALLDTTGQNDLSELRSFQDWYLRYWLESVEGVSEVASVGGFVKQYQVNIDPDALLAYNIPLKHVIMSIQRSNNDVGGRVVEMAETEYMVRGRGYIQSLEDVENVPIGLNPSTGTPVLVKDIARVQFGPEMRRGAAEYNGMGEVVGGIVVMRFGENALKVIDRVKEKLEEVKPAFPPGVEIVTTYDRSDLIHRSIKTLIHKLAEEMLIVSLVIIVFLWHFRSALVPILTLPIAALLSFIPMISMNLTSNVMSLGGIAIAIGAMVDAAVIIVENGHKRLEEWERGGKKGDRSDVLLHATQEVGRPLFFSLLVIAVSFMPIFALQAQEGRLFKPLAFTKNFSMFFAAFLAVTLVPVLMQIFVKPGRNRKFGPNLLSRPINFLIAGTIHHEDRHPVSRFLFRTYSPVLERILRWRKTAIVVSGLVILSAYPVYLRLGSEFMPPLNEGDILYMPTTLPGISIETARQWLQAQDKVLKSFPEVETVFGKIGRARTPTDPAPLSMVETTVHLKPHEEWPPFHHDRWYSSWSPSWLKSILGILWPEMKPRTWEELINAMDREMRIPGTTNAWTMPIKTRIDMLTTGIRTPIGIKIYGPDLKIIQGIGETIEGILPQVEGTRSVYAERVTGGYFLDFNIRREEAARYGLTISDVEDVIETAVGGKNISVTIEGRERYPINLRYARELRDDLEKLKRVLVPAPTGAQIPIGQLAEIQLTTGAPLIKDENGMLTGWVYIDLIDRDVGSYVKEAKALIAKEIEIPAGYYLGWSGQFEYMERAMKRMTVVLPLTLFIIFFLLYINTRSVIKTGIVLLAVPFSLVGAIWLLYILGYNMSIAVWVGLIALAGVDAETGVVMLLRRPAS